MSSASPEFRRERFEELLVDRALYGLPASEQEELQSLARELGLPVDGSLELTVATLNVGLDQTAPDTMSPQDLPPSLREQSLHEAADHVTDHRMSDSTPPAGPAEAPSAAASRPAPSGWTTRERLMLVALAASLVFGLASFAGLIGPDRSTEVAPIATVASLAEQRQELIKFADATLTDWITTDDPAAEGASGDVVWSDELQQGFLRIRGLPVNDPDVEQYQLWVFDTERDEELPVDGGVFDIAETAVTESGDVIIPIDAKLQISRAWRFAVTIEPPGGVVQSDRSRLPLLATLE